MKDIKRVGEKKEKQTNIEIEITNIEESQREFYITNTDRATYRVALQL